jgi:hypothetical protein
LAPRFGKAAFWRQRWCSIVATASRVLSGSIWVLLFAESGRGMSRAEHRCKAACAFGLL